MKNYRKQINILLGLIIVGVIACSKNSAQEKPVYVPPKEENLQIKTVLSKAHPLGAMNLQIPVRHYLPIGIIIQAEVVGEVQIQRKHSSRPSNRENIVS